MSSLPTAAGMNPSKKMLDFAMFASGAIYISTLLLSCIRDSVTNIFVALYGAGTPSEKSRLIIDLIEKGDEALSGTLGWLPTIAGAAFIVCILLRLCQWAMRDSTTEEDITPDNKKEEKAAVPPSGGIICEIDEIGDIVRQKLSTEGKASFKKLVSAAKMLENRPCDEGKAYVRISEIYLPALREISDKIAASATDDLTAKLMPLFIRACDVVREAAESIIEQNDSNTVLNAEATVSAIEKISALKHDTDEPSELVRLDGN